MTETILAIDLGGTRFRAATATMDNPVAIRRIGEAPAPTDRGSFLELIRRHLEETGASRLGIGIPGLARGTVAAWVPNLGYLDGLDLGAALAPATVALGNDAQFALVAESVAGAARGLNDAILLAIGTGIGSAVLADGAVVTGSTGAACSFGWAVADVEDMGDGQSGWLERSASGRALDRAAASLGLPDGGALVQAARNGDSAARAALAVPMRALGTALAGAVALLDPAVVILAGGVANSLDVLGPLILPPLRRQLPPHLRPITLRVGEFGASAGLVGAAIAGARGPDWRHRHG
jgi:glucokinase